MTDGGRDSVLLRRPRGEFTWRSDLRPAAYDDGEPPVDDASLVDRFPSGLGPEVLHVAEETALDDPALALMAGMPGTTVEWTLRPSGGAARYAPAHTSDRFDPGPWLVPTGDPIAGEWIAPLGDPDLIRRFTGLAHWDQRRAILDFAKRYGWLGLPQRLRPADQSAPDRYLAGESLGFWQRELNRFMDLWWLHQAVRTVRHPTRYGPGPRERARAYLAETIVWDGSEVQWRTEGEPVIVRRAHFDPSERDRDRGEVLGVPVRRGDVVGAAAAFVVAQINARLRGRVSPVVVASGDVIRFQPEDLLGAIYLLVARRLHQGGGRTERSCANPDCPTGVFFARGNQVYCSEACRAAAGYRRRRRRSSEAPEDRRPSSTSTLEPSVDTTEGD